MVLLIYRRSGNFRDKNNSCFKFSRVKFLLPDGSAMKRVYVYLIFARLIFATQATGKKFLTPKISRSTVLYYGVQ